MVLLAVMSVKIIVQHGPLWLELSQLIVGTGRDDIRILKP
jgi:hypothetical protein